MNNQSNRTSVPEYIRQFFTDPPLLLKNFHYEDTQEFLDIGEVETYPDGEVIIQEGENVHSAYLIAEGQVSIIRDGVTIANLGRGGFLGEACLFSKNNRIAKGVSSGGCRLLHFQRYDTLDFFMKKPEKLFNIFTRNIIEVQQDKLYQMNERLAQAKKELIEAAG